jgi:two-component system sensor histidine kinase KdpD
MESGMLTLNRRSVDLPDLARAAIDRAGPELSSRELDVSAPADSGPAIVDPALGARLAANFLRNAARYSPAGAPIEFSLRVTKGDLVIRVRDRGPGVPEAEIASLFAKFKRGGEASGPGLGLGLAICKGIAEAHGGSITARNAPDGGLEVEAVLPFGNAEAAG